MARIDPLPSHAPDTLIAVEQADIAVARKAAKLHDHPAVEALGTASEIADQPPLIALSAATLVVGLVLRRRTIATAGARMLAAHLVATAMKAAVKRSVDRTRPHVLAEEGRYAIQAGGRNDPRYNSFPSGHTAGAVAVAQAVARTIPGATLPARLWATAIAAIQIPRCSHYPSDIAAGALIGVVADRLVRGAERGLGARIFG